MPVSNAPPQRQHSDHPCEGSHPLPFWQAQIDAGFVVTAFASAGSRFKLLLFEQQADNRWELVAQVGWRGSNAGTGGAGQVQGWHSVAGLVSDGVALQAPGPMSAPLSKASRSVAANGRCATSSSLLSNRHPAPAGGQHAYEEARGGGAVLPAL